MKIFLDGQEQLLANLDQDVSTYFLTDIVNLLGLKTGHLAIRVNNQYVSHKDLNVITVTHDDQIELINMYAGG